MPRRKSIRKPEQLTKPPKTVPILFSAEMPPSAHILNLPDKLNPEPPVPFAWKPPILAQVLSRPSKFLKKSKTAAPAIPLIIAEGLFLEKDEEKITTAKKNSFQFRWPSLRFKIHRPSFKLPRFSWPTLPKLSLPAFHFLNHWQKAVAGFILTALILTAPLPALSSFTNLNQTRHELLTLGSEAFEHINNGQKALLSQDLVNSIAELQLALELFSQAQEELDKIHPAWRAVLSLIPGLRQEYLNGERLLLAGANLTWAALPLLQLASSPLPDSPSQGIEQLNQVLSQTLPKFQATRNHLNQINPAALPLTQRSAFQNIKQKIEFLTADLEKFPALLQMINSMLGAEEPKRYLLIFQNNYELRPTGGFMGSFALLDLNKGKIKNLIIPGGGTYELQGSLKTAVLPPPPLQLLQPRWEFQDANWFPDFPASAKKIAWFYEKGGGPTVDGVIALDTNLLVDFLKVTGEIALPEYGLTVTAQNFVEIIQKYVEIDYDKKENRPKKILGDLAPKLLEKIFSQPENFWKIVLLLNDNLKERHLQLYFNDPLLQTAAQAQGWAGEIKDNSTGDFLMVNNSNVAGGGKTDEVIKQNLNLQTTIESDGSIINKLTIIREHGGLADSLFANVQNVSYLRLYAPANSQLIEAQGFTYPEEKLFKVPEKWYKIDEDLKKIEQNQTIDEQSGTVITQEFGKTSFGNWAMVKPGQTTAVSLTYRLPFKLKKEAPSGWRESLKNFFNAGEDFSSYSLLIQKQAGRLADNFSSSISFPADWQVLWQDPLPSLKRQENQIFFSTDLSEDRFLGLIFQTK